MEQNPERVSLILDGLSGDDAWEAAKKFDADYRAKIKADALKEIKALMVKHKITIEEITLQE